MLLAWFWRPNVLSIILILVCFFFYLSKQKYWYLVVYFYPKNYKLVRKSRHGYLFLYFSPNILFHESILWPFTKNQPKRRSNHFSNFLNKEVFVWPLFLIMLDKSKIATVDILSFLVIGIIPCFLLKNREALKHDLFSTFSGENDL